MTLRLAILIIGLNGPMSLVSAIASTPGVPERSAAAVGDGLSRRALTKEELEKALAPDSALSVWINRLEGSVARGESGDFDVFLKPDWLLDAIVRPVNEQGGNAAAEIESAFAQGTRASWASRSLAADYLGHQFRFLRVHVIGGRAGLLFRSAGEAGQLNYCLFSVAAGRNGELLAEDLYVVGMGEWISDTLRRGYLTLVESLAPRGESGRRARLYVDALSQITAMQVALLRKEYAEVLAISSRLPTEVRQDRQVMLTRLEAAERMSLSERARVFGEWKTLHPTAEQLPLKWADYHIATGDFEEARRVLAALNERLGGDSYLMLRLGEIKMLAGHHAAGRLAGTRLESDPAAPQRVERAE
jgi:hypothetical protein